MSKILHTIILYIASTLFIAAILNIILYNIVYYFISSSETAITIAHISAWTIAILWEIRFVHCRPLTKEEKKNMGTYPKIEIHWNH